MCKTTCDCDTEVDIQALVERIDELEQQVDQQTDELHERVDDVEATQADHEQQLQIADSKIDGTANNLTTVRDMVGTLQARELKKDAHLPKDDLEPHPTYEDGLGIPGDELEYVEKDAGTHIRRIDGGDDPIGTGGAVQLAREDLLPIQRLAQFDDDILRRETTTKKDYIAAKVWQDRQRDSKQRQLWRSGCKGVREYMDASDLRVWIRRNMDDVTTDEYAKKLARETITDALPDLAKNRIATQKKNRRKDGLQYKEWRAEIRTDVEIPGETRSTATTGDAPETNDVPG